MGGIAGVIYEEFLGKKFMRRHLAEHKYIAASFTVFGLLFLLIGTKVFSFNSIYLSSALLLITGGAVLVIRHDLFKQAFYSGLFLGALTLVFEALFVFLFFPNLIVSWWLLDNISHILIWGVPIEEVMFAFALGFVVGPIYELVFGLRLRK